MSLVPIIFFLAGRLCCRANFTFAADLTLRADLFQAYWLIISCHFCFLQDLFLMRCSLSIFFAFGSRITAFIWWICNGKNSLLTTLPECKSVCWINYFIYAIFPCSDFEKFDIFRFSNVNLRTLGSPLWVKFPPWGEVIRAHKTLWQHSASLESNY